MEPSLTRELGNVLSNLNQTLQQMRFSIEDMRRQPLVGGFASSFSNVGAQSAFLNTLNAGNLYAPERFAIQPRVTFTDLLYTAWRGVPVYRPYITPTEQLQAQGIYSTFMGANSFGLVGQGVASLITLFNPLLGLGLSAASAAAQGLFTRYVLRFPEIEQTRQVLSPHFSDMTRTGYKGMSLNEAQRAMNTIIDLSMESAAFGVGELRDLTARISRTNLLSGVRTVEDFKQKMRELMNSVREITGALHVSYEDAVNMLSQLSRYGFSPSQTSQFSYYMRNIAAGMGVNAGVLTSNVLQNLNAYNQMGMTAAGSLNVAALPPTILATLRSYLPRDVYNSLGISGRQEEILSGLEQGFTKLLSENVFQMAILGANQLGIGSWSANYQQLIGQGASTISKNPILANPYARMAEIGRILEQNPELLYSTARQYVRFYTDVYKRTGASADVASRTAVQRVFGISQPEVAQAIAKGFETIEPWQIPVEMANINEIAAREQLQDKLIYQRQDYVAQAVKNFISRINIFSPNWVGWRALNQRIWERLSWSNLGVGTNYISSLLGGLVGAVDTFLPGNVSFSANYFGPSAWQAKLTREQLTSISNAYNLGISGQRMYDVLTQYGITENGQINASVANLIATFAAGGLTKDIIQKLGIDKTKAFDIAVGQYVGLGLDPKVLKDTLDNINKQLESGVEVKITDEIKINRQQWKEFTEEERKILASLRYILTNPSYQTNQNTIAGKINAVEQMLIGQGFSQPVTRLIIESLLKTSPSLIQELDFTNPENVVNSYNKIRSQYDKYILPKLQKYSLMNYNQLAAEINKLNLPSNIGGAMSLLTGPAPDFNAFQQLAKRAGLTDEQILDLYAMSFTNPNFARYVSQTYNYPLLNNQQVVPYSSLTRYSLLSQRQLQTRARELRTLATSYYTGLKEEDIAALQSGIGRSLAMGTSLTWFNEKLTEGVKLAGLYGYMPSIESVAPEILPIAFLAAYKFQGKKQISAEELKNFLNELASNPKEAAQFLNRMTKADIGKLLTGDTEFIRRLVSTAALLELPSVELLRNSLFGAPTVSQEEAWKQLSTFSGRKVGTFEPLPQDRNVLQLLNAIEKASQYSDPNIQRQLIREQLQRVPEGTLERYFGGKRRQDLENYIINNMLAPKAGDFNKMISQLENSNKATQDLTEETKRLADNIDRLNSNIEKLITPNTSTPRIAGNSRVFQGYLDTK